MLRKDVESALKKGQVIPAHPRRFCGGAFGCVVAVRRGLNFVDLQGVAVHDEWSVEVREW